MYQAFCDQKGKVPYIPMSRLHPYGKYSSTVCTEALGLPLVKPDTVQQDALKKWHGAAFV